MSEKEWKEAEAYVFPLIQLLSFIIYIYNIICIK